MDGKEESPAQGILSQKRTMYLLMAVLVIAWGLEYICAKHALTVVEPLTLLFLKYITGGFVVLIVKLKVEGKGLIRKKDIPLFLLCAFFGEVGYFYCEFTAMSFLPVSLITIVLAFVPVLSIIIDRILYKKKATKKMVIAILFSIIGIILIIGIDYEMLFQGRAAGYLLAFGAVIFWNIYNFLTASLHEKYSSATLTLNQIICSVLLVLPYALTHLPDGGSFNLSVLAGVLYLGAISTGIGFLIFVKALHVLGPTVTAVFSNFLPVSATFLGWLILKENILPLQIAGGVVVIVAGFFVIKERALLEELPED